MQDDARETDPLRQAAMVISDLLAFSLMKESQAGRSPYVWEEDALRWLSEQRRRDPDTPINAWTADVVRAHDAGARIVAGPDAASPLSPAGFG